MNDAPEIRDIAPPVEVFPYPLWLVVTATIAILLLLTLRGTPIWYYGDELGLMLQLNALHMLEV